MRVTQIDFEGRHEIKGQSGHWYATAQRRDGMHNGPDTIEVTIIAPDMPDGRKHHVNADCQEDVWSMAECLQHHLDGYDGSNSEVQEYHLELLRLSNC
jgi:hypothetical protein